jgi:hypothetical protein
VFFRNLSRMQGRWDPGIGFPSRKLSGSGGTDRANNFLLRVPVPHAKIGGGGVPHATGANGQMGCKNSRFSAICAWYIIGDLNGSN